MAITSPFKGRGHSRNSSNVTTTSIGSSSLAALAQQYENDKAQLIKYCFSRPDENGNIQETYITHVRVTEYQEYPSQKPPAKASSKLHSKSRVLALAVKKDGTVYLHKGREANNGIFQIGRSWSLEELTFLKREVSSDVGFLARLGKDYYWETNSTKERQVFITSLVRIYRKFKNGLVPQLINWDLSLFGLDEQSYNIFLNKEKSSKSKATAVEGRKASTNTIETVPLSSLNKSSSPEKVQSRSSSRPSSSQLKPAPVLQPSQSDSKFEKKLPQHQDPPSATAGNPSPLRNRPSSSSSQSKSTIAPLASISSTSAIVGGAAAAGAVGAAGAAAGIIAAASSLSPPKKQTNTASPQKKQQSPKRKSLDPRNSISSANYVDATSFSRPQSSHTIPDSDYQTNPEPFPTTEPEFNVPDLKIADLKIADLTLNPNDSVIETVAAEDFSFTKEREGSDPSLLSTVTKSLRDIEIVGHRKSINEFEEDQEREQEEGELEQEDDSEDITELYYASNTPEVGLLTPSVEENVFPLDNTNESQDFSFDQTNDSQDRLDATPATIKAIVISDDETHETDQEYDELEEEIPKLVIRPRRNTLDSFGFESVTLPQAINDSSVVGVFDDLQWGAYDDADTLIKKLNHELSSAQYSVVKNLVDIKQKASTLQSFTDKAIDECDRINPLLSYFQIELAGFAKSIQHVESINGGVQVESMNRKDLWHQLHTILNTVSVDEDSLKFLLSSDIDYDISVIERILGDLQSAILEINGTANHDTIDTDLGEMKALKDRRNKYETVIVQFLQKIVNDLDARFKATFGELLASKEFESAHILVPFSKLMTYSTLVLFAKEMSDDTFDKLIGIWEGSANIFYEQILHNLTNSISYSTNQSERFTLSSSSAFKDRPAQLDTRTKIDHQQERLKQKLGLLDSPEIEESKPIIDHPAAKIVFDTFETLQRHLLLQQNFIIKFFHVSNDDILVKEYIQRNPFNKRLASLNTDSDEIATDRENARELYQSVSSIFEPEFDSLMKAIVQSIRHNQKNNPSVILYLELFARKFRSSNQEFLMNGFKAVSDRLKADWMRFLDIELKTIEKTALAAKKVREVSIYIKNFTSLISHIETNHEKTLNLFPSVDKKEIETRDLINKSYEQLSSLIMKNLENDEDLKSSVFSIEEINVNKEKRNRLINLIQNSNWIVESVSVSKLPQLTDCVNRSKNIYNLSRNSYVSGLVNEYFGKVAVFVNDVNSLVDELSSKGVDPSKRNAYTKDILSKLLANYNSREINKTVLQVRKIVVKHFDDGTRSPIQKQLIEKIWSATQAQFVSTTLGLENIVSTYYRDIELQFSKKDIIAAFNNARI